MQNRHHPVPETELKTDTRFTRNLVTCVRDSGPPGRRSLCQPLSEKLNLLNTEKSICLVRPTFGGRGGAVTVRTHALLHFCLAPSKPDPSTNTRTALGEVLGARDPAGLAESKGHGPEKSCTKWWLVLHKIVSEVAMCQGSHSTLRCWKKKKHTHTPA